MRTPLGLLLPASLLAACVSRALPPSSHTTPPPFYAITPSAQTQGALPAGEGASAEATIASLETTVASLRATITQPALASQRVRDLLSTDRTHRALPSWWGITPGTSSLVEAQQLITPLASFEGTASQDAISYFSAVVPMGPRADLHIAIVADHGLVNRIQIDPDYPQSGFFMTWMLEDYGAPDEVWVSTWSSWPGLTVPVTVYIVYLDKGIMLQYSTEGIFHEGSVHACFVDSPVIRLWEPGTLESQPAVMALFDLHADGIDLPSQQALSMEPNEFYELHQGRERACIETPTAIWTDLGGGTPAPG